MTHKSEENSSFEVLDFLFCRVSDPDPDSIRSVDPDQDPYSESGSGSRRAKMTHKSRKN
jgi:hypothetical protein